MREQMIEIQNQDRLRSDELRQLIPLSEFAARTRAAKLEATADILAGRDDRLIVVAGYCAEYDQAASMQQIAMLAKAQKEHQDVIEVMVRIHGDKPRSKEDAWKGVRHDHDMSGKRDPNLGRRMERETMAFALEQGLGVSTEVLDPEALGDFSDIATSVQIGARTSRRADLHDLVVRSGLPTIFKHGLDGDLDELAIQVAILQLNNPYALACLRGRSDQTGQYAPNYDTAHVAHLVRRLEQLGGKPIVAVDTCHGNNGKDIGRNDEIAVDVAEQLRCDGTRYIKMVVQESAMIAGSQALLYPLTDRSQHVPGQSVVDPCVGIHDTLRHIEGWADAVRAHRQLPRYMTHSVTIRNLSPSPVYA